MSAGAEHIETALAGVRAKIAEVMISPAMNYSIDGQSVDKMAYYRTLLEMEKQLVQALIIAQGPFEHTYTGTT